MGAFDLAWTTFGRALFTKLAATAAFLAIVAAIVFAPNGMRAVDAVRMLDRSVVGTIVVWLIWISLAAPAIADSLRAPGTTLLRSLPIAEGKLAACMFAIAALTQVPWAVMFGRGDGVVRGLSALTISIACSASLVGRWRFRLIGFPIAMALVFVPAVIAIPISLGVASVAGFDAWRYGALPPLAITIPIPRFAPLALIVGQLIVLLRGERTRLFIVFAIAAFTRWLCTRLDADAFSRPQTLLAFVTSLLAAALAPPIVREAARVAWLSPRAWLPFACGAFLLIALAIAFARTSGLFAVLPLAVAEIARRKKWSNMPFGIVSFLLSIVVAVVASELP